MGIEITCDFPGCEEVMVEPQETQICRIELSAERLTQGQSVMRSGSSVKAAVSCLCPVHRGECMDALVVLAGQYGFDVVVT